nr:unnamed protein product [Digitaria exilis]
MMGRKDPREKAGAVGQPIYLVKPRPEQAHLPSKASSPPTPTLAASPLLRLCGGVSPAACAAIACADGYAAVHVKRDAPYPISPRSSPASLFPSSALSARKEQRRPTRCASPAALPRVSQAEKDAASALPSTKPSFVFLTEQGIQLFGKHVQLPAVMKIVKANGGSLSNFEVLDFLRSRGAKIDPMGCLGAVAASECKVYEYLLKTPACNQTRDSICEFLKRSEGYKLADADKLNVINWRPSSAADAYAMIEECGRRFNRDERGEACDEDERVQEFLDMVKEVFPSPPPKAVADAEEDAEAEAEAMQE